MSFHTTGPSSIALSTVQTLITSHNFGDYISQLSRIIKSDLSIRENQISDKVVLLFASGKDDRVFFHLSFDVKPKILPVIVTLSNHLEGF